MSSRLRWVCLFGAIFLLSLDIWWWNLPTRLGPFGFPWWVYYFVGLQIVLAIALGRFAARHWPSDD